MLDIHMPGLDGQALLEQLRLDPHTEDIPVVMVTNDRETRQLHRSYMNNANAFITKPLRPEHLDDIHAVCSKGTGWKEACH